MNRKEIDPRLVLITLLILTLIAVSCGAGSDSGQEAQATEPPVATVSSPSGGEPAATQPAAEEPTTAPTAARPATKPPPAASKAKPTATAVGPATAQPPTNQPTVKASPVPPAASDAAVNSYRVRTTWRENDAEGPIKDTWLTETIVDPPTVHQKGEGGTPIEVILIGLDMWTRMADMPWRKVNLSEEEMASMADSISQMESPVETQERTPLEDDIEWLQGQRRLNIAEGSLTETGQETINGVRCKRFGVDSTYTYKVEFQAPLSGAAEIAELIQGELWVADQRGWPAFVVRAQLLQTTTTQVEEGGSSTETVYIEENVTDVNSPDIVIEPPKTK